MRWTVLVTAMKLAGCGGDDGPIVSADNLAERYSAFEIDDSIGIGCASYTTDEPCGKSVCSETITGPCFLASDPPVWLATTERSTFTLTDTMSSIVIDDTNGLLCIGVDGDITTCFAQSDLVADGIAALRAQASR